MPTVLIFLAKKLGEMQYTLGVYENGDPKGIRFRIPQG
jgi:hypothetical protein